MAAADSLDTAANAFQASMEADKPAARAPEKAKAADEPRGEIFDALGEDADTSGGGDYLPPPEEDDEGAEEGAEEGDEDTDEEEEEEEGEPEEYAEGDLDPDKLVTITVDGQQKKVKLGEALEGYIRTDTFHTRLNKINEVHQAVRAEAEKVLADREKYVGLIDQVGETLTALLPKEPDWDKLFQENPAEARVLQKRYSEVQDIINGLATKRQEAVEEAQKQAAERTASYMREEFTKFSQSNPEAKTPEQMKSLLSEMRATALKAGFSEEEVGTVYDSRMLKILQKATAYDRLMAKRPKPVSTGKKPVTPGAGSNRTAPKALTRAQERLRRTGSIDAATDVFKSFV